MRSSATYLVPLAGLLCLFPAASSTLALFTGVALALTIGNPYGDKTRKITHRLLAYSVVGLGAGIDLHVIARVGRTGIAYTFFGISLTLIAGKLIGRLLETDRNTSLLISAGTAICGGSAIAALAPTIRAKPHEVSVALGTVFMLNAVALFLFPLIGHHLSLSETQFGFWSALAIHDTSSVVGATLQYGSHALEVGTTVKLVRALWIVPLTAAIGYWNRKKHLEGDLSKPKRPWFILGFLLAAGLVTWIPELRSAGHLVESAAKRGLVLTLFLIGSNLSRATLQSVGLRPFLLGVLLWLLAGGASLGAILLGWI